MNRLLERFARPAVALARRLTFTGKLLANGLIVLAALAAAMALQYHALSARIAVTQEELAGGREVRAYIAFWREVVLVRDEAMRRQDPASGAAATPTGAPRRLRRALDAARALDTPLDTREAARFLAGIQALEQLDSSATELHWFAAYTKLSAAALDAMEHAGRRSGLLGDVELATATDAMTRYLPSLLDNASKQHAVAVMGDAGLAMFAFGAQLIFDDSQRRARAGLERLIALDAADRALIARFDAFVVQAREIGDQEKTDPHSHAIRHAPEKGERTIREGFSILEATLDAIQAHLERRLDRHGTLRLAVSGAVIALTLGLLYLSLGGALSVRDSLRALERGSREFRAGRLEVRVAVESRDEFAAVAENFNTIAEEFNKILRARAEAGARAQLDLELKVAERTEALTRANRDLAQAMQALRQAQESLIESGKMAALAGLVAGVAHEVNTPIGLAYTMVTHLEDHLRELARKFVADELRAADLERFLAAATPSAEHAANSLRRAADLVQSFKQVAVDQASEARRTFDLGTYLREIVESLRSALRRGGHRIECRVAQPVRLDSYPGALSQIVTNVILNAVTHAFEGRSGGLVRIEAETAPEDRCVIRISDDGKGMLPGVAHKVFEPFFTTRRGKGGSGLGLHIAYNLAAQRLGGTLRCESAAGKGSTFTIEIPAVAPIAGGGEGPEAARMSGPSDPRTPALQGSSPITRTEPSSKSRGT